MIHRELIDMLMDHYENPRNYGVLEGADFVGRGGHSGCGDTVTVYLKLDGEVLKQVNFEGKGCMVSQSAASLLTEMVSGKKAEEVSAMDRERMIEILGREIVVRRPRCSMLALETIKGALIRFQNSQQPRLKSP